MDGVLPLTKEFKNVKVEMIEKADHQLTYDNPKSVCEHLIKRKIESSES